MYALHRILYYRASNGLLSVTFVKQNAQAIYRVWAEEYLYSFYLKVVEKEIVAWVNCRITLHGVNACFLVS